MTLELYYFSSTGNSLHTARRLAEHLGTGTVIPVPTTGTEIIASSAEAIGIVFPVYLHDAPDIIRNFIGRLEPSRCRYIFAVATHNGEPGQSLAAVDRLLKRNGSGLSAGFELLMPGNCIIIRDYTNPEEERNRRLSEAEGAIVAIAEKVRRRESIGVSRNLDTPGEHLRTAAMHFFVTRIYRMPQRFHTSDRCTACGLCGRLCPTENITLTGGKVQWGRECLMCLGCYHWCPQKAVELDTYSRDRLRYHHPEVTLKDMLRD